MVLTMVIWFVYRASLSAVIMWVFVPWWLSAKDTCKKILSLLWLNWKCDSFFFVFFFYIFFAQINVLVLWQGFYVNTSKPRNLSVVVDDISSCVWQVDHLPSCCSHICHSRDIILWDSYKSEGHPPVSMWYALVN